MQINNLPDPAIERPFTSNEILSRNEQLLSDGVQVVATGVCALLCSMDGDVFYARHTQKDGPFGYPEGSVGTLSETLRWANAGEDFTESPMNAMLRSFNEELSIDYDIFEKASMYTMWENPARNQLVYPSRSNGKLVLDATTIVLMVDNPEALEFSSTRSEEILYSGFAPLEEVLQMEPFRPGFSDWYRSAFEWKQSLIDLPITTPVDWQEPKLRAPIFGDVRF